MAQMKNDRPVHHKKTLGSPDIHSKKERLDKGKVPISRAAPHKREVGIGLIFLSLVICAGGFYPVPYTFSKSEAVPFTTSQKDSGDIELGDTKVLVQGSEGSRTIEVAATRSLFGVLFRWEPQNQTEKSSVVIKKPVTKVQLNGTLKYQYMLCSNGSAEYYTDDQFKDPKTGFTSKSEDACEKNKQGHKVSLTDSIPSNNATSTASGSTGVAPGGVSYEAQKIQREADKMKWCIDQDSITGDEYMNKVHYAQAHMEYGSKVRNTYLDAAYFKYSNDLNLLRASGCTINSTYPNYSH